MSDPTHALYAALAKAQGQFKPIPKNRRGVINPKDPTKRGYEFRYADLQATIDATRPALSENGLCVIQTLDITPENAILKTVLAHAEGGTLESVCSIAHPHQFGGDPKQFGIAMAYLRRYQYTAILCLAADDDLDEIPQDEGDRPNPTPQPDPRQKLEPYPQDKFDENFDAWAKLVGEGKQTGAGLLAKFKTKNTFTPEQEKKLLDLDKTESAE